jgi:hypothetical protein
MRYPVVPSPEGEGYKLRFVEPPVKQPSEIIPVLNEALAGGPAWKLFRLGKTI